MLARAARASSATSTAFDSDGLREAPDPAEAAGDLALFRRRQLGRAGAAAGRAVAAQSRGIKDLRVEFVKQKWPDQLKAARLGQLQMWQAANISVTSEASRSSRCCTGENAGFSNLTRFKLPEYDRLYVQARSLAEVPSATS